MSYGLVCDTLHAHRKVVKAGLEAMGLWALALSWSKAKRSAGFIPADVPPALADDDLEAAARCVDRLVKARLWEAVEGGWVFHDWHDVQRGLEDEDARRAQIRAARADAGRRGGLARASNAKQTQATEATPSKPKPDPKSEPEPEPKPKEIPPTPLAGGHGSGDVGQGALPGMGTAPPPPPAESKPRKPPRARRDPDQPTADQRYRAAYVAGIREGAPGKDFSLTGSMGLQFYEALQVHAKGLEGPDLDAWIQRSTAEWRRSADPNYVGGWRPAKFIDWLNTGRPAARASPRGFAGSSNVQPVPAGGRTWIVPEGA